MASYSTNANVQNLVYGTTNSDLDTVCSNARDVATSIINAHLNLTNDIASPSNSVTRCCTLLASGIISTSPEDKVENNTYWKMGMELLKSLTGDVTEDAEFWKNITCERF